MSLFEKTPSSDPGATPDGASGEQRIVALLKHLFREYAHDAGLDSEQMRAAKMQDFVAHCTLSTNWYHNADIRGALQDTLKLRSEDIETVWTMFQSPWSAMALLLPVWHMLALSGQPPVKNIPEFIHLSVTIVWNPGSPDDKALQIQVPTKWKADSPLTNGFLCSLLKDQFDGMLQIIAGNGLDALYAKHAVPVSASPDRPRPLS